MTGPAIPFYAFHKFIDYGNQMYDTYNVYVSRKPRPVDPFYNLLKPFHWGKCTSKITGGGRWDSRMIRASDP